jgi:hypothetical protein
MKYCYTVVNRVRGVLPPADTPALQLVATVPRHVTATFTDHIDDVLKEGDRYIAVANMMLTGGLGLAEDTVATFPTRLATAITAHRDARRMKYGARSFLIITFEGDVELPAPEVTRQLPEFDVCINGFGRGRIRTLAAEACVAVVAGMSMAVEEVRGIDKVIDFVIFYHDDGKPVYAYDPQFRVSGYGSHHVPIETLQQTQSWFGRVAQEPSLARVSRLLVSSLGNESDPVRAFFAAWNALEILLNKVFATYEREFFTTILVGDHPKVRSAYLSRVRNVMTSRTRLADKFAVISHQLDPTCADADATEFAAVKSARDQLAHGQDVVEDTLPVKECRRLARKYLRLHLGRS